MIYDLLQVGTDAEVFLRDKKTNWPVPVGGKLGGNKENPIPVKFLGNGFAVQEDNVAAEFNVPPASHAEKFSRNIEVMLGYLRKKMAQQNLELVIEGSLHFSKNDLENRQAQTFGCDPDMNAWTKEYNELARWHPLLDTMRTASAHIHVSYMVDRKYEFGLDERILAVRAHDLFVGVPSILLDPEKERRQIYGKSGAFRVTNYGHEYRTPSNFWIKNEKYRKWVFNQTKNALDFASSEEGRKTLVDDFYIKSLIQEGINEHHEPTCDWLCDQFGISLP